MWRILRLLAVFVTVLSLAGCTFGGCQFFEDGYMFGVEGWRPGDNGPAYPTPAPARPYFSSASPVSPAPWNADSTGPVPPANSGWDLSGLGTMGLSLFLALVVFALLYACRKRIWVLAVLVAVGVLVFVGANWIAGFSEVSPAMTSSVAPAKGESAGMPNIALWCLVPLYFFIMALGAIIILRLYKNACLIYPNAQGQYPVVVSRGGLAGLLRYALLGKGIPVYHDPNRAPGPTTAYARNGAGQPVEVMAPLTVPGPMQERVTARAQASGLVAGIYANQRPTAAQLRVLMGQGPQSFGGEEELIELAAPLPDRAMIYDAHLDGQLCLPIGEGVQGQVAPPLRNLGNGVIGGLQGLGK